jgi:uncharacterized repeat protein (TIGR03803 family)
MDSMKFPRIATLVLAFEILAIGPATLAQGFRVIHANTVVDAGANTLIQNPGDGLFYGTTLAGGANALGSVFRMDASGNVSTIHSFAGAPGDGASPHAGLFLNTSDGLLYGTTNLGGTDGYGTVFKMDTSGGSYALHSQPAPLGVCQITGSAPWSSFFKASDGNLYVTMMNCGDIPENGVVDRVGTDLSETEMVGLPVFGDMNTPFGHVVEGSDGKLYGTCSVGYAPVNPRGGIYRVKLTPMPPTLEIVHDFALDEGYDSYAPLLLASDGYFYGTTSEAGNNVDTGTIFKVAEDTTFQIVHLFTGADGRHPSSGLMQASDGNMYGVTTQGGAAELGVIYRLDSSGNYTMLASVGDVGIGSGPASELLEGSDGKLYGTTGIGGGPNLYGTIFTIDLTQKVDAIAPSSGTSARGTPVTISGGGFVAGASVTIEGANATGVAVPDAAHVTATTPANPPGTIGSVRVVLPDTTVIILNNGWMSDFLDVPTGDIFHDYVRKLLSNGITAGCGGGNYCRNAEVTRAQMAVFLLKSEHGSSYLPPNCTGLFFDVPCPGTFSNWIEQLANEGITGGCGGGNYCPTNPVTRQQMAVFLLKTEHGSSYVPPGCTGIFGDVACPSQFADWIEQLYTENVTGGCQLSPLLYCPGNSVLRGQMSAFLTKTFNLP